MPTTVAVVGQGRAGSAFASVLADAGWDVKALHHGELHGDSGLVADLVLLCVPDGAVSDMANAFEAADGQVVAHCSGSLTLEVLDPHPRRGSVHPLMSIPPPPLGAQRLVGAWFAIAGDPLMADVVAAADGRAFEVRESDRALYHATSAIASNHVVALLGQVERLAGQIGVPFEAYLELSRASLDNVSDLGAVDALTGPVARGDWATVQAHVDSLPEDETAGYVAMVELAKRLVEERVSRDPL
jgi:predicted short-subunit dehydrogenase-like oxidoreductase (DUF2520 family)